MQRFLLTILLSIIGLAGAAAQQSTLLQADEAFRLSVTRASDGGTAFRWEIADGYYLYRQHMQARDAQSGQTVPLQTSEGVKEDDPNFGTSEVYYRSATAELPARNTGSITLIYQGCKKDSICYPPLTQSIDLQTLKIGAADVGFTTPATPSGEAEPQPVATGFQLADDVTAGGMIQSLQAKGGVLWVLAGFLAFGVFLAFTPCVLPMYPILSATLAREGEALTPRRGFILSLTYALAMAVAFGVLGFAAAWSGQNLQVVLQSPIAVATVAIIFAVLATSMFGLFELQLPAAWINRIAPIQGGRRGSIGGAAAIGFTSALIVGPCVTAPLAAALLYIAQTGNVWLGAAALFALGFGQGIPLIALGTLGGRALPRVGVWMVQIKYVFGFIFLGAAVWMADRILPAPVTLALWAALLMAVAVFVGAFDTMTRDTGARHRFRKAAGLTMSLGAVILGIGAASGGTDPLRPLAHMLSGPRAAATAQELTFARASSPDELQQILRTSVDADKPTLVYFTADWCVTCRDIERSVLPAQEVMASLQDLRRVKVDLSSLDATNQRLMKDLAVVGPPTMIFFNARGTEAERSRLVGEVSPGALVSSATLAAR